MAPVLSGLLAAVSFLTRVPLGGNHTEPGDIGKALAWFPFVGALVGLAVAATYGVLYPWLPSLLSAVIAVAVGVGLTGALHEDGLADTFDGLGAGVEGAEALTIMRDARIGTYGAVAVVISLLGRIVAVASLTPAGAVAGLVTAHALGRLAAVLLMSVTPPARSDGVGRSWMSTVTRASLGLAVMTGAAVALLAFGRLAVVSLGMVALAALVIRAITIKRIGGATGDVLGACEQIGEILVLTLVAGAAWRGWSPWWEGQI